MIGKPRKPAAKAFVVGAERFARISAVEGIHLDAASRDMFARFEAQGLSPAERRAAIQRKHASPKRRGV